MASILPLAKTQFTDGNGAPLAFGSVDFYVPNTQVRKDTWQDSSGTVLNTNPVILDADGRAILYGTGQYRQVVSDNLGNQVWDQLTGEASSSSSATQQFWGGTAAGTANALIITIASGPSSYTSDLSIDFIASATGTGPATVNVNGIGLSAVENGGVALVGGELQPGRYYRLVYGGASFQLVALAPDMSKRIDVASASSVDLTQVRGNYIRFTGVATINTIVMLDSQWVDAVFEGILTLNNGASLILLGGAPITTAAGDTTRLRGEAASITRQQTYSRAAVLSNTIYGLYRSSGIRCKNNAGTPNTQFDLNADGVQLRDSGNGIVVRYNPGAITNDINAASPNPNARDQAGGFSSSTFIHFYWIWNGSILATLSSAAAPPTGPTLPSGYTHWSYAGAVRFNAGALVKTYINGALATIQAGVSALAGGGAINGTPTTAVDVSASVPSNAVSFSVMAKSLTGPGGGPGSNGVLNFGIISGTVFTSFPGTGVGTNETDLSCAELVLPNIGQQLFYAYVGSVYGGLYIDVLGYRIPNGDV